MIDKCNDPFESLSIFCHLGPNISDGERVLADEYTNYAIRIFADSKTYSELKVRIYSEQQVFRLTHLYHCNLLLRLFGPNK